MENINERHVELAISTDRRQDPSNQSRENVSHDEIRASSHSHLRIGLVRTRWAGQRSDRGPSRVAKTGDPIDCDRNRPAKGTAGPNAVVDAPTNRSRAILEYAVPSVPVSRRSFQSRDRAERGTSDARNPVVVRIALLVVRHRAPESSAFERYSR